MKDMRFSFIFIIVFFQHITTLVPVSANTTDLATPPPTISTTIPTNTTIPSSSINATSASTTAPTTSTLSTTAIQTTHLLLSCTNGGELQNGFCVCPVEWTGRNCSIENICMEETIQGFTFPRTIIGWFSYSKQKCGPNTSSGNVPRASARCTGQYGTPKFDAPNVLKCDITLSNIQGNLTSTANLLQLASSAQILTSNPETLTADNVTKAIDITNTLLERSSNISEAVAVAALTTVSQLLDASVPDSEAETSGKRLTESLQNISLGSDNTSLVVQPNLAVQSVVLTSNNIVGVQFSAQTGLSSNFSADRIRLNTNASELGSDNGEATDVQVFIRLSPGMRHQSSSISVGFVLYQNDRFFKSRDFRALLGSRRRVISGNVKGAGRMGVDHVEMVFKPVNVPTTTLYDFACVFWNYNKSEWSTEGCSKVNVSSEALRCVCNHTTNFAALMSYRVEYVYSEALDWITYLGCSMSVVGLVITIVFYVMTRKSGNSSPAILMVSLCVSLLIFTLLFLLGINNTDPQSHEPEDLDANVMPSSDLHIDPDHGPCTAVAVLLQYFLMATFVWNSLYACHMFLLLWNPLRRPPSYLPTITVVTGWGVPALIVSITLGVTYRVDNPLNYRREEFCWLAAVNQEGQFDFAKPMFWGFLIPVALILIFNTVILCYFSYKTCRTDPELTSTKQSSNKKKLLSSFSLSVVLGLSWIIGYLMLIIPNKNMHFILSIVFCLCTTTQGLQIFILFVARTSIFRQKMLDLPIGRHIESYTLRFKHKNRNTIDSFKELDTFSSSQSKLSVSADTVLDRQL
ncbi:adhesion G-protein coupled receptor G7-like [Hypomesus transpacificus]|uniref:adhesion G-protein coupled receptor G7-like n=1 Tax=Hypomesus transpacificus TaxID=137520 RepID=UPI001F07D0BE|nr:adhesion G-protein coupled receptor G7-like [Hypomesus transpacificus]